MTKTNKTTIILSLLIIAVLVLIAIVIINYKQKLKQDVPKDDPPIKEVDKESSTEVTDLDINFLKIENEKANKVYSPLSIRYALTMLKEGSTGDARKELNNLLGKQKLPKYNNVDDKLSLANSMFIRDSYEEYIKSSYIDKLKNNYNAEIVFDEFKDATNVNKWIEDKTFGLINKMLKDETVQNPFTQLLLINALAIDLRWEQEFRGTSTNNGTFYLDSGKKYDATMMHRKASSRDSYYKDDDVTVLKMNLEELDDASLEFDIIMPNKSLKNYIEKLDTNSLNKLLDSAKSNTDENTEVRITVPRFKYDYDLKLKEDLEELGVKKVFEKNSSSLTNISKNEDLFVSDAKHKALIEFKEKGVTAAAATVIVVSDNAILVPEQRIIDVKIDKPFMYIIRDKKTGATWFVGTVYEPNAWENDKKEYEQN